MKLEETTFLWMPNNDDYYTANPRQGKIALVARGHFDPEYPCSGGACDLAWAEARSHEERVQILQFYVSLMIWGDEIAPEEVRRAFALVEDLDIQSLDFDRKPENDTWGRPGLEPS